MSYKALIYIALVVLIVQVVINDAEPMGHRRNQQLKKVGSRNANAVRYPYRSHVRIAQNYPRRGSGVQLEHNCKCDGKCKDEDCSCDCHNVAPAALSGACWQHC